MKLDKLRNLGVTYDYVEMLSSEKWVI